VEGVKFAETFLPERRKVVALKEGRDRPALPAGHQWKKRKCGKGRSASEKRLKREIGRDILAPRAA